MFVEGAGSAEDLVADRAIKEYAFSRDAQWRMINLSENATYLVEDPGTGTGGILRVHREGYHDAQAIESELDWLDALHEENIVDASKVIRTADGRRIVTTEVSGRTRHAVLFETMGGLEPDEAGICANDFHTLGAVTARLHSHSKRWRKPAGFARFSWDWTNTLGEAPRWGRWQDAVGIGTNEIATLEPAVELIHRRLERYGQGPDRFGLVHADLRLANLLVDADQVNVIDFDDCGFGWFLYDFGTAVSFIEHDSALPRWQEAWLSGYRTVAELSDEDEDMLATFVMLRRMLLVAWMGSHSHSQESRTKSSSYAAGTCELATRYLDSAGSSLERTDSAR